MESIDTRDSRWLAMDFPERLARLRKDKGLTQRALASLIDLHVSQVRRYENGASQPTLDVLRKLARTFSVSADLLLFDKNERGPDQALGLQLEAISQLDEQDREAVIRMIEALIIKKNVERALEPTKKRAS